MTKKRFYTLNLTWGLPLTILGAAVALFLLASGHRPTRWGGCFHFTVGKSNWGGLSLGLVILTSKNASEGTKNHELGHAVQNCYFGLAMLPLTICSAARYHVRNFLRSKGHTLAPYDSWWFEGQATRIGKEAIGLWKEGEHDTA